MLSMFLQKTSWEHPVRKITDSGIACYHIIIKKRLQSLHCNCRSKLQDLMDQMRLRSTTNAVRTAELCSHGWCCHSMGMKLREILHQGNFWVITEFPCFLPQVGRTRLLKLCNMRCHTEKTNLQNQVSNAKKCDLIARFHIMQVPSSQRDTWTNSEEGS